MSKRVWEISWSAAEHCKECRGGRAAWHIQGAYPNLRSAEKQVDIMLANIEQKTGSRDGGWRNGQPRSGCYHVTVGRPDDTKVRFCHTSDNGSTFYIEITER